MPAAPSTHTNSQNRHFQFFFSLKKNWKKMRAKTRTRKKRRFWFCTEVNKMMPHVPKLAGTESYFRNCFRYFSYFTHLIQQINQPLANEIHQLNWAQNNIKHIGSSYSMTFVSLRGASNPPYKT